MTIGVIGGGRWGSTLATLLSDQHRVVLACLETDAARLLSNRSIPYVPGFKIPKSVTITAQGDRLHRCELVFIAVPGQNLVESWQQWNQHIRGMTVIATKSIGVRDQKLLLPLDMINASEAAFFGSAAFPQGLLAGSPTMGTVYTKLDKIALAVQAVFPQKILRVYTSADVIGGQIGSALKNVIALASGIAKGMGFDEMTQATLISRGSREMELFARAHGGRRATFAPGSTIHADITGTSTSLDSHNLLGGMAIAAGTPVGEVTRQIGTIEGIHTLSELRKLPKVLDRMPIANAVSRIIFDGVPLRDAAEELLSRSLKAE